MTKGCVRYINKRLKSRYTCEEQKVICKKMKLSVKTFLRFFDTSTQYKKCFQVPEEKK